MACILSIETATTVCSVALSVDGKVLFEKVSFDGPSHAALLGPFVQDAVRVAKEKQLALDAVAVSSGPGSYTGLRIGVSEAKGLCFGYGIPLISIPTLDILAAQAIRLKQASAEYLYCAMLDARRMEVYAAVYDSSGEIVRNTEAEVVDSESYLSFLVNKKVCFFGNGAEKCRRVITSGNAVFLDGVHPVATEMVPLADKAYAEKKFVDTVYFEPFYLKEFVATIAKNKVLGS